MKKMEKMKKMKKTWLHTSLDILGAQCLAAYTYQKNDQSAPIFVLDRIDFGLFIDTSTHREKQHYILITKDETKNAVDAFPLKFFHMKEHAVCIHGKDFLKDVHIDKNLLRLNIESELRNKMIQLREDFLSYPKKSEFFLFILPMMRVFWEGIVYLHGDMMPDNITDLWLQVQKYSDCNSDVFVYMYACSIDKKRLRLSESVSIIQKVHDYLGNLAKYIDTFDLSLL